MKRQNASAKNLFFIPLLLLCLAVTATAVAQPIQVYPLKNVYLPGEPITVAYRGVPGTGGDWVTLVSTGTPADEHGQWLYIEEGSSSGTLSFDGLSPGRYEVRLYLNWPAGGYNVVARQPFSVERGINVGRGPRMPPPINVAPIRPPALPLVAYTQKETYFPFEPIIVNFQDLPGNDGDWLTIVPAGARDDNPGQWRYTGGKRSGTLTFFGRPRGRYEVRVYLNWPDGGYTVAARHTFWVQ